MNELDNHTNLSDFVCPNLNDSIGFKKAFWKRHPIQVSAVQGQPLPFDPSKLYYRLLPNGERIQRKWLSYSLELNKLFCASCMAFGDMNNRVSPFVVGHTFSIKHSYKAVQEHENSSSHKNGMAAALQSCHGADIGTLISKNLSSQRSTEINNRRLVIKRIIDIILFIGRQGLAYRGKEEAAYTLNTQGNHGNFLELVKLLAEYDVILQKHVQESVEESKKKKDAQDKGKRRFSNISIQIFY